MVKHKSSRAIKVTMQFHCDKTHVVRFLTAKENGCQVMLRDCLIRVEAASATMQAFKKGGTGYGIELFKDLARKQNIRLVMPAETDQRILQATFGQVKALTVSSMTSWNNQ